MGLLSNVVGGIKKSFVGTALDTLSAAFIKPVETVEAIFSPTKKISDVIKKVDEQSLSKNITATVVNTGVAAATVVGAGYIAWAARAGTLASAATKVLSSIANKPKLLIATAVAAPIVTGAVIKEPVASVKTIANAPGALANFGGNLANLAANPSTQSAKQLVSENPVISSAAGLLIGGTVIKTAAPVVSNIITQQEMKKQTSALERQANAAEQLSSTGNNGVLVTDKSSQAQFMATPSNTPKVPITPQTQTVSSGVKKKKRKRKHYQNNINQIVSVNVSNKNSNVGMKKYLNREVLFS